MISFLLFKKIVSLYLILLMGYAAVKTEIIKPSESKVLSAMYLYFITPSVMITSFQIDHSPDIVRGLLLSILAAFAAMLLSFLIAGILKRPLKLSIVEQAAFEYPNVGNLIIPLVTSVLGPEYVVYCSGFIIVQMVMTWTHLVTILSGEKHLNIKKLILNPNMLAILAGLLLFLLKLNLPNVLYETVYSMSSMVGPMAMFTIGIIMGGADLRKTFAAKRVWLITLGRIVIVPLITLPILKFSGLSSLAENGKTILMITLMGASAPTAANLTQMSQIYSPGDEVEYVSAINVLSTLCCVVTMPLMVALYQL